MSGATSGEVHSRARNPHIARVHASYTFREIYMSYVHPAWAEHQRKRFTRADAYRLAPPGSPEAKPPGWLDPSATRVRLKEAQEEEARARAAAEQEEFEREVEALRAANARVRIELADVKFALALRRIFHKYSPDQPRDERGRWTDSGAGASRDAAGNQPAGAADSVPSDRVVLSDASPDPIRPGALYAQNTTASRYSVDLREEEARGGHTVSKHVNKSPEALIAQAREAFIERPDARDVRSGSFSSLESATKLVNSTLAQNKDTIDKIANGVLPMQPVFSRFDSITGMEAVAAHIGSGVSIRETYGVGVIVAPDSSSPRGYTVWTAFPSNPR